LLLSPAAFALSAVFELLLASAPESPLSAESVVVSDESPDVLSVADESLAVSLSVPASSVTVESVDVSLLVPTSELVAGSLTFPPLSVAGSGVSPPLEQATRLPASMTATALRRNHFLFKVISPFCVPSLFCVRFRCTLIL